MSVTYKFKATRYLREYTAATRTPTYAAATDAQAFADSLCDVPWTRATVEGAAICTNHNEATLDKNTENRELIDAALWCGEHADGLHRAYGQSACYRMTIPEAFRGKSVSSIRVRVNCDPYNSNGARISFATNSTGVIPTACAECRTGSVHAEGVAPRVVSADGRTWYSNSADCELVPEGGVVLGTHAYLFVLLEQPAFSRDGWLESCVYISPKIEVEFADQVDGYANGDTVDCTDSGEFDTVLLAGGVSPTWLQPLNMLASTGSSMSAFSRTRVFYVKLSSSNYGMYIELKAKFDPTSQGITLSGKTYLRTYSADGTAADMGTSGVALTVSDKTLAVSVTLGGITIPDTTVVKNIAASATSGSNTYKWNALAYAVLSEGRILLYLFGIDGETVTEQVHSPIDFGTVPQSMLDGGFGAGVRLRAGDASDEALGDMSWQIATADTSAGARTASDTFAHIMELTREVGDGVAADYAFAGVEFPLSDLDRVTVVPRFVRASSVPSGQLGVSQPGISLWYHKTSGVGSKSVLVGSTKAYEAAMCCSAAPSFLQGSFIAVRSPVAGNSLVLTAVAAVANTGIEFKLAVWKSSGVAWEGSAGYHTAQQFVKVAGFVDGSELTVQAPQYSFSEGTFKGLPSVGGVSAERVGLSETIAGALAANDKIEIRLSSPVSADDVLIIAPIPVGLSSEFTGADAYFGRQSNPASETTKSWCRYSANLGWFPKVAIR